MFTRKWRPPPAFRPSLLAALLLAALSPALAYVFTGVSWPAGTTISMQLAMGTTSVSLQDASGTWNNCAANALALWNQQLQGIQFSAVPTSGTIGYGGDAANTVFFSSSVFGTSFGTNTLAVTVWRYDSTAPGVTTEADTVFNRAKRFDSYRGPQQWDPRTGVPIFDLQRVALHEFGHVLGLSHPDENGQPGRVAVMNSQITDLDHLADDDIAGARALYAPRITSPLAPLSTLLGAEFTYQITASNSPTSFGTTGLPAGLQLDPNTGLITGTPSTAGSFYITLTATGNSSTATANLSISVSAPRITSLTYINTQLGSPFTYYITANNSPTSFTADGLPAGLQLDPASGLISGTPAALGTFRVTVTASAGGTKASAIFTFYIVAPTITSTSYALVQIGDNFSYRIMATNSMASFSATPLPPGLQLDPATGIISGIPTQIGTFAVTLIAFGAPADATAPLTINVAAPMITSSYSPPSAVGSPFRYQITATNKPTSFSASGLPAGLVLDPATGVISGIPTLSGNYSVSVVAYGSFANAVGTLRVTITPALAAAAPGATFPVMAPYSKTVATDPKRPRVYVASATGVEVINVDSMTSQSVQLGYTLTDLAVSADASTLWLLPLNKSSIGRLDLETLTVLPELSADVYGAQRIREGVEHRLYVGSRSGEILQLDAMTGATQTRFGARSNSGPVLELSPDRRSLYTSDPFQSPQARQRFDISTAVPSLSQQTSQYGNSGTMQAISHSGEFIIVSTTSTTSTAGNVAKVSSRDLTQSLGTFPLTSASWAGPVVLDPDDSRLFVGPSYDGLISVFDTTTFQQVDSIKIAYSSSGLGIDNTGTYLFVASDAVRAYRIKPAPPPVVSASSLLNVSTRLRTEPGDGTLIGGFIIQGKVLKKVALRAIGPSLPLAGRLADPVLELYDGTGNLVASNDNWNAARADVLASGLAPRDEHEAVIIATLAPGNYTAAVRGVGGTSGVGLVELYDLQPNESKIANISTRGQVAGGDNVMIGGFIVAGDQPTRTIVRAIGPSLSGILTGALADTTLELHDSNGALVAQNDDWRSDQEQEIIATGIPPRDERESAIVRALAPGNYTAIVRGKDDTTGVGLVEVYNLDAN